MVGYDFVALALTAGSVAKPLYFIPQARVASDVVKSLQSEKNDAWYSSIDIKSVENASHVPISYILKTQKNAMFQLSALPSMAPTQAQRYLSEYRNLITMLYEHACGRDIRYAGDGLVEVSLLGRERDRVDADLAAVGRARHIQINFKQVEQLVKKQLQQPKLFQ